ncbi:MAG TPA: hypothetical protein V6C98_01855 [Thermosynechococcaceae cyanobacterium]|jgi:hypothetical protein
MPATAAESLLKIKKSLTGSQGLIRVHLPLLYSGNADRIRKILVISSAIESQATTDS